jgi:hypothetical protein
VSSIIKNRYTFCCAQALLAAVAISTLLVTIAPSGARAASPTPLGISEFTLQTTESTRMEESPAGSGEFQFINEPYKTPFTQAGGHPWALTTTIVPTLEEFKATKAGEIDVVVTPTRDAKDIVASLPPGLLGDPMAVPRCSLTVITNGNSEQCPADTQIGVSHLRFEGGDQELAPIVNVTPEKGQSAEFAIENTKKVITPLLTAHLVRRKEVTDGREQETYGFTLVSQEIPQVSLSRIELTFWGVPADQTHFLMRGRFCKASKLPLAFKEPPRALNCEGGFQQSGIPAVPFITMPTDCSSGPEVTTLRADSWQEPGSVKESASGGEDEYTGYTEAQTSLPAATGCNRLSFNPSIEVQPDKLLADEPVELNVKVKVPLNEAPASNATPQLRNTIVTLPEGMSVSPGIVDGIQACNEFGPEGINITGPLSEEEAPNGELRLAAGHCPDASIVGEAEAITPFLPVPVKGHVYLARPLCGGAGQAPCTEQDALDGHLYRLYLELGGAGELANTGIEFKVPLETEANPATGQLTTRTLNTVQAPFGELKIKLNGGPRAPIANPAVCGIAETTSDFTPWSAPGLTPEGLSVAGTPDATSTSFFDVTGCGTPPGLVPGFTAGTVTTQAGAFTPFTLNLSRQDREQYIRGIQVHTPPGLLGILASVPLCGAGEAETGACPESSKIGTTRVATGAGSHPFEIEGNVYLTGPYEGAPFGLSIVTHAVAGPFNLGLVVVRARINVNPNDSTLTVSTDETGPHALPQIIFGVPLRLKRVTVNIDRPGFMFNPTNCSSSQAIEATISGSQNATAHVSSPFAVGGCKSLAFKPKFTVSTSGSTSRVKGASLDAKVSYPAGSLGTAANISRVKVDLPRQLPSRLTTLQKACPAATFEANPATCPAASVVGIVRATTPLLPVGLSGPVYFVSHGGEQFPSLIVVLQGDNVRVDLVGTTFISKKGITSSTFKTVPDVPVNTFELYLPQGKFSALAANGKLCNEQSKLNMPTEFVAQNGAVIKETTKIAVTGCAKSKAKTKKAKKAARGATARGRASK